MTDEEFFKFIEDTINERAERDANRTPEQRDADMLADQEEMESWEQTRYV